jgi:hypothetical protein
LVAFFFSEAGISGERSSLALRLASVLQETAPRLSFARPQRLAHGNIAINLCVRAQGCKAVGFSYDGTL